MRHPLHATLLMALTFSLLQPPVLATGQPQSVRAMDQLPSLPVQLAAAKSPGQVVNEFYQANKRQYWRAQLTRLKQLFSRELYDLLVRADKLDPESGEFLDYDPFSNSQMGVGAYSVGAAKISGASARVPITVIPGDPGFKLPPGSQGKNMVVLLKLENGSWKIDDLDTGGGEKKLKVILKELLAAAANS